MKRFLAWLALVGCYIAFCFVIGLDMALVKYLASLYVQLSAFLKLVIIIVGGSFVFGLATAPLFYGIPLTYAACEAICPSRRGVRYIVMGILILICCVLEAINGFLLRDIFIGIYGIALISYCDYSHK